MSARNRQRRQVPRPRATAGHPNRLPLRPLQLPVEPSPAQLSAEMFGYLKRVLVDGELPECDAGTAAALAGMILGQRVAIQVMFGMPQPRAVTESLQWIADQAALSGSLAASEELAKAEAPSTAERPTDEVVKAETARYALAVMDGSAPASCPAWMAPALAAMWWSAMTAGYQRAGDGMDIDQARATTRAQLNEMTGDS